MTKTDIKTREHFTPHCVKLRESGTGRTIEGRAIVFNKPTVLYDGEDMTIREVILPSCVKPSFLQQQDIKLNLLHNRDSSFARYFKGSGSLKLEIRNDGLYFSAEAPECDLGTRAIALVSNGTYSGCSFEFYEGEYDREEKKLQNGKIDILYTHRTFASVSALTIAMDPAYDTTSVAAREGKDMSPAKRARIETLKRKANSTLLDVYGI